jgi:hypothetical protein
VAGVFQPVVPAEKARIRTQLSAALGSDEVENVDRAARTRHRKGWTCRAKSDVVARINVG